MEVLKGLIESIRGLKLKKLHLSLFEFRNQETDSSFEQLRTLFNELPIIEKKLT